MSEEELQRYHYTFINNTFGSFVENTLDYFGDYLYPRFQYQVVANYDKAVEYLTKSEQYGREVDKPQLPALILNPSGDFNLDDANSTARQLWRFPNLAPGLADMLYEPIYQDSHISLNVSMTRLKGEFELLMLLNSFYEYFDVKLLLIQIFGGEGRPIYPKFFNSFIIIPDELYNYQYTNDVTGQQHGIDWDSIDVRNHLVKTTNRNEYVYDGLLKPRYTLNGLSDNSSKYGGTDSLAEWKLTAQIGYELEIPSYFIMKTDWVAENIHLDIRFGSTYTKNPTFGYPPFYRDQLDVSWQSGLEEATNSEFNLPDVREVESRRSLEFKTRYYHQLTQSDIDSTASVKITIPEEVESYYVIYVNARYGELSPSDHYTLEGNTIIELLVETIDALSVDDIIEVYIYKRVGPIPEELTGTVLVQSVTSTPDIEKPGVIEQLASDSTSFIIVSNVTGWMAEELNANCIITTDVSIDSTANLDVINLWSLSASSTNITTNVNNPILRLNYVKDPVFIPLTGTYVDNVDVCITSDTVDSIIYYTVDSSNPDVSSLLYNGCIALGDNEVWVGRTSTYYWDPELFFENVKWVDTLARWEIRDEYIIAFNSEFWAHNYRPASFKVEYNKYYGGEVSLFLFDGDGEVICGKDNYQSGESLDCTFFNSDISGFKFYTLNNGIVDKYSADITSIEFKEETTNIVTIKAIATHPEMNLSNVVTEIYTIT